MDRTTQGTQLQELLGLALPPVAIAFPAAAPAGSADTRYCLRVGPYTGSRLETVQCWTRQQWAEQCDQDDWPWVRQCVDVDKEWAKEGVGVTG